MKPATPVFTPWTARLLRPVAALVMGLALTACATSHNRDPLETMNRKIFGFNEAIDQVLIRPVATGYAAVVPSFAQTAFSNVINNIKDVWSAANLVLQGRPGEGAQEILRVGINTTLGLGGLLDIATPMQLERHQEDLGQTLGVWGVSNGAYLVLPLLGPSTIRDALALPADLYFSPSVLFHQVPDINSARAITLIHTRAQLLDATALMSDVALDKYAFVREAHLQRRSNQIYNGYPPDDDQSLLGPEQASTLVFADAADVAPSFEQAQQVALNTPVPVPVHPLQLHAAVLTDRVDPAAVHPMPLPRVDQHEPAEKAGLER